MTPTELYRAVLPVVRRERHRWPAHVRDDVEQEVWVALMAALPRYIDMDVRPTAWAATIVAQEGGKAVERQRLVARPRRRTLHEQRVAAADSDAMALHGRPATDDDLRAAGVSRLSCGEADREPMSLDVDDMHDRTASGAPTPEQECIDRESRDGVAQAVDRLVGPYRAAVVTAYGLDGGGGETSAPHEKLAAAQNRARTLARAIAVLRARIGAHV